MEETRLLIKCTSFVFLATSNCGLSPKNDKLRLLDMMLQQIFYFRLKDVLLNFDFDSNKIIHFIVFIITYDYFSCQ